MFSRVTFRIPTTPPQSFAALALLLMLAMLGSCRSNQPTDQGGNTQGWNTNAAPQGYLSVYQAAQRAGLRVEQTQGAFAVFTDGHHRLLIIGPPNARAMLNGRAVDIGPVATADGQLFLSQQFPTQARQRLAEAYNSNQETLVQLDNGHSTGANPRWPANQTPTRITGHVVIDAGHGGRDPGAPNKYGPVEKEIVLDTSLRLAAILRQAGAKVTLTRDDDSYPTLAERVELSNKVKPDLFISVHADSFERADADGYTVYIARQASQEALSLAKYVELSLRTTGVDSRGIRKKDYFVVKNTQAPALLIELGFLSNPTDSRKLGSATHRQRMAQAIAQGVIRYLAE